MKNIKKDIDRFSAGTPVAVDRVGNGAMMRAVVLSRDFGAKDTREPCYFVRFEDGYEQTFRSSDLYRINANGKYVTY